MAALSYVADGLWIVSLTIMVVASRAAERGPRPPGKAVLWSIPALSLALSLVLLWAHRTLAADAATAVMMFGLRATLAAACALGHLAWLRRSSALRP